MGGAEDEQAVAGVVAEGRVGADGTGEAGPGGGRGGPPVAAGRRAFAPESRVPVGGLLGTRFFACDDKGGPKTAGPPP
ncbi:hypothetical protein [Streptomyces griseomycini]|uniref:Uncharacterized protein n=1 Tax=Streptomyces griseomycini TaxID=66895 RepID=A0A7W7VA10_9ACTN|nr:hypothetical protein [Streptomyces griseomycini]MBB4902459.1 hypothetical protein [Streptomyces griseomycini]GGR46423.1 hypothetical protein GCM10015536_60290 [Streptomyces griseomycini]